MVSLAYDFTGDGWPDVLVMSGNAGNETGTLYVNPKGESRFWDHYVVVHRAGNEETLLKDYRRGREARDHSPSKISSHARSRSQRLLPAHGLRRSSPSLDCGVQI